MQDSLSALKELKHVSVELEAILDKVKENVDKLTFMDPTYSDYAKQIRYHLILAEHQIDKALEYAFKELSIDH